MQALLTLALLAAAAPDARVLVLEVEPAATVSADVARTLTEMITTEVGARGGLEVISSAELIRLVDLAAEQQRLGCDDDCLAELAGATNADYVVSGRLSELGSRLVLQLNLFDARAGRALSRANVRERDLDALGAVLEAEVRALLSPVRGASSSSAPARLTPNTPLAIGGLATAGVGALTLVVGPALASQRLEDGQSLKLEEFRAVQKAGVAAFVVGAVLVVAGGGAAAASLFVE